MTVAVLGGVLLVTGVLAVLAPRQSLFYLAVLAAVSLPASYWRGYRFRLVCTVFIALALALAASPLDMVVRSDGHGPRVRVLPADYGRICNSTERACYGCVVPAHPVEHALVISY
jgi:hypothetical protein